jgi:phage anti-repressor protein
LVKLINKKDKICIEHQKLIEFEVINTKRSNHIKDCLEKFKAIENIDYKVLTAERSVVKRVDQMKIKKNIN